MSSSGIVFSGLASGLDTQAIISALVSVEQRPINALEKRKQSLQSQLNLFGDLESKLSALRDAADAVRKSTSFLEFKATADRTDFLTASAGTSALQGTYSVKVNSLAQAQSNKSDAFADDTTAFAPTGGTLTFTVDGVDLDVVLAAGSNLQDVALAINATGQGINAQVVRVDEGDYRLVVTGEVGEDKAFTVSGSGSAEVTALAAGLDANSLQSAGDAEIDINGLVVKRNSNSISDAIQGVTLELGSADPASTTQITVAPDASATADKVQKFVDAYNGVVDFVKAQNVLDEDGKAKSALFGDTTLRTIQGSLRGLLGTDAQTSNSAYTLLSQVGIVADRDGKLTFTRSDFEEAVADDEDAVEELFSGGTGGIAKKIYDQVDDYLDTVDGLLVSRKNGFNVRLREADRQIETAERRLVAFQSGLERKFANLEVLMNQLQGQGAALGGIQSRRS